MGIGQPSPRTRAAAVLVAAALAGAPALVLRALCAGQACASPAHAGAEAPFCSLPRELRSALSAGYYDGRSPDVLAVARAGASSLSAGWPSLDAPSERIPIVFWGTGVAPGAVISAEAGLEDIAPTIADMIALEPPHPEVRSGSALPGVASGERPRLVLQIVVHGPGAGRLLDSPESTFLARLRDQGAATVAETPSQPADSAARLTTIGTGGSPRQHGITGTFVRNDLGKVARAWGPGAPDSVIASLGDDLDHAYKGAARVGLIASRSSDRGLIGGGWYVGRDRDDIVVGPADPSAALSRVLSSGYGQDRIPDLMAVTVDGATPALARKVRSAVTSASRVAGGSAAVVLTSTGSARYSQTQGRNLATEIEQKLPGRPDVVEAVVPGGLFLDHRVAAAQGISGGHIVGALRALGPPGQRLFADAFVGTAVAFGRYC